MDKKALVVIEDRDLSAALARAIESINISIEVANDGIQAINSFIDDYDFLLVDENITRVSVKEVISSFKEKYHKKIVFIANDSYEKQEKLISYNCDEILFRPFTNDELLNAINQILNMTCVI